MKKVALSALLSSIVMVLIVVNGLLLPAQKAQAEFLQVADLPTVEVAAWSTGRIPSLFRPGFCWTSNKTSLPTPWAWSALALANTAPGWIGWK